MSGITRIAQGGTFATLVADPAWKFGDKLPGAKRGAEKHYRTMTVDDIMAYPLPPLLPDCRLFLWRVASMQEEALRVVRAWGFVPKAEVVWIKRWSSGKPYMGMGHQVRNAHESCIIATRGRPPRISRSVLSYIIAPIGRHSEKPEAFYRLVERVSPGPIVELFARKRRPGWACTGDELPEEMVA